MAGLILESAPLGFPWPTVDPFLFCVHQVDHYPAGNDQLGPAASLAGRAMGSDFAEKNGWRMYHGQRIPGFPQHPHRGFETVTIVRRGFIDHSDSLGATARFGRGDVQWLTAGSGIVHSEMFPLLERRRDNPLELFQIWLNLPAKSKMVKPHFSMMWDRTIPRYVATHAGGPRATAAVVAGSLGKLRAPAPPPDSWASQIDSDVAIYTIELEAEARLSLPGASHPASVRALYFFGGPGVRIGDQLQTSHGQLIVRADVPLTVQAVGGHAELLLLQGRPLAEPVAHHGPFVMTTRAELLQAIADYQRTQFGGWPWPDDEPVHAREEGRFARHADGRMERPEHDTRDSLAEAPTDASLV